VAPTLGTGAAPVIVTGSQVPVAVSKLSVVPETVPDAVQQPPKLITDLALELAS
jgi:hypothetical protein